jgi:hyperosmotically inducible protein
MDPQMLIVTLAALASLSGPVLVTAAADTDATQAQPVDYVKDSMITSAVRTRLAADKLTTLERIGVETDKDGTVWLTGSARTQASIDKAVAITRETKGVKGVQSALAVVKGG